MRKREEESERVEFFKKILHGMEVSRRDKAELFPGTRKVLEALGVQ